MSRSRSVAFSLSSSAVARVKSSPIVPTPVVDVNVSVTLLFGVLALSVGLGLRIVRRRATGAAADLRQVVGQRDEGPHGACRGVP